MKEKRLYSIGGLNSAASSTTCPRSDMTFSASMNAVLSPSVLIWQMMGWGAPHLWGILCRFPPQPVGLWVGQGVAAHSPKCSTQLSPLFLLLHSQFLEVQPVDFLSCGTFSVMAGRGSYPGTSTGDSCTGRHTRY